MKVTKIGLNELSKFFRKNLRDPAIRAIIGKSEIPDINDLLEKHLPEVIFNGILEAERNIHLTSVDKSALVNKRVYEALKPYGLTVLMPILLPMIQNAVIFVYKEHFMAKFSILGIHEYVERITNIDLDGDGDIGQTGTKTGSTGKAPAST